MTGPFTSILTKLSRRDSTIVARGQRSATPGAGPSSTRSNPEGVAQIGHSLISMGMSEWVWNSRTDPFAPLARAVRNRAETPRYGCAMVGYQSLAALRTACRNAKKSRGVSSLCVPSVRSISSSESVYLVGRTTIDVSTEWRRAWSQLSSRCSTMT